eukprot:TRINITY_DN10945_c0_g1_i2.p1 TRINITY_DN10945_c0_g1~~TRINITY_DN10945_c0_g1_i2.p1  ORF type:complete len:317 (-),score=87.99 TRINITY_DN10945_c0_g1_i2:93-1043(-)
MIRRPPRSTQGVSSAASDVYKRQVSTQSTWAIAKIQELESRLVRVEQDSSTSETNGSTFSTMLARFSESTEKRLGQIELALTHAVTDQRSNKEQTTKLEGYLLQSSDELKEQIGGIQREWMNSLDTRTTELLNKLKFEQDERAKLIEDLRYKIESRGKLQDEERRQEKDNIREIYNELDGMMKNEITRRSENLKNLEASLDGQIKALQNQVRKEEINRAQQELMLKSDITKLAEQLRTDYELFKSQQNQLTEKMTEMIKLEVESRLSGEQKKKKKKKKKKKPPPSFNTFRGARKKTHQKQRRPVDLSKKTHKRKGS